MAHTFQDIVQTGVAGAHNRTITIPDATGRKLVCCVMDEAQAAATGVTFNSQAATSFQDATNSNVRISSWYYDIPDALEAGNYTLTVALAGSAVCSILTFIMSGRATGEPKKGSAGGTSTTLNVVLSGDNQPDEGDDVCSGAINGSGSATPLCSIAAIADEANTTEVGGGAWSARGVYGVADAAENLTFAWGGGSGSPYAAVGFACPAAAEEEDPVDLTPAPASLVIAGGTPTVVTTAHVSLTPDTAALQVSGGTPTVVATAHVSLTPTAGQLVLTGGTATVAATSNIVLTPAPAAIVLTGGTAGVAVTGHVSLTPAPASLQLSGGTPTVQVGLHVTLTPAPASLVLSGGTAAVATTAHTALTPASAALVLSGGAPAVELTSSASVTPAAAVLVITGQPAAVLLSGIEPSQSYTPDPRTLAAAPIDRTLAATPPDRTLSALPEPRSTSHTPRTRSLHT